MQPRLNYWIVSLTPRLKYAFWKSMSVPISYLKIILNTSVTGDRWHYFPLFFLEIAMNSADDELSFAFKHEARILLG